MRLAVVIIGICALLALLWIGVVAAFAYASAPKMLHDAGTLELSARDLPEFDVCALLTLQDPTFYRHHGVALFAGKPGHTTITQSIGKWLYFRHFDPGFLHERKIRLMAAAIGLDRRVPKEQQLRLFLNRTYFGTVRGSSIHGFAGAARTYFKKDVPKLSPAEFLSLAVMVQSPDTLNPARHPAANARAVQSIEESVNRRCRPGCVRQEYGAPCSP